MASILILISSTIGPDANIFNIYHSPTNPSNDGTLVVSGITKQQLLSGYTVNVPDGTTIIRVRGADQCTDYDDALIPCTFGITATPTPTPTPVFGTFTGFGSTSPSDELQNDEGVGGIVTSTKFRVTQNGSVVSLRFFKPSGMTGLNRLLLYEYNPGNNSNILLVDAPVNSETSSGWQSVQITPVNLFPNVIYRIAHFNSVGDYISTDNGLTNQIVNGPIIILADGESGANGEYIYTSNPYAIPNQSYFSSNYWMDIQFAPSSVAILPSPTPTRTPTPTPTSTPYGAPTFTPTPTPTFPPVSSGQTSLTFTLLDSSIDVPGYGRSLQEWIYGTWEVDYPNNGDSQLNNCFDLYQRFEWRQLENDNGTYNFNLFDQYIQRAINNQWRFNFDVMPYYADAQTKISVGGGWLSYPLYLHNQMQAEATKDWLNTTENAWVPDWNSESYLDAWQNLHLALAQHIANTSHNGVPYSSVIGYVGIRGYGSFGEWHSYPWGQEAGALARPVTVETAKRLVDININAFPNYWGLIGWQAFGRETWDLNLPEFGYYALTASNNKGRIGWFRDSLGGPQSYYNTNGENNTQTFSGQTFATLALNTYRYAPVGGEPFQCCTTDGSFSTDYYYDLFRQVTTYKLAYMGNGNLEAPDNPTTISRIQQAGKSMGYRIVITSGSCPTSVMVGVPFTSTLSWRNNGIAPVYDDWDIYYQLRNNSNNVVWKEKSNKSLKLFLNEDGIDNFIDELIVTGVTQGTYRLELSIEDPLGYKKNFRLAIQGKTVYDSYVLVNNFTVLSATPSPTPTRTPTPTPTVTPTPGSTGSTQSMSFTIIPTSDPDILNPMRGMEYWQNQWPEMNHPDDINPQPLLERYWRYNWFELETGPGQYDFSKIDEAIKDCIDSGVGRKFYFGGIMAYYDGWIYPNHPFSGGRYMSYPLYLHQIMMDEPYQPYLSDNNWWVPNWNSESFLNAHDNLMSAIRNWMDTTYYKGVRYIDVMNRTEIRSYGNFGEWHQVDIHNNIGPDNDGDAGSWPVGMRPTFQTLKRISDAVINNFSDKIIHMQLSALDANFLANTYNPPEIAQYLMELTYGNGKKLGIRRDNWNAILGLGNTFYQYYLEYNTRFTVNGQPAYVEIMDRWKYAPIGGEPICDGTNQEGLLDEVNFYRCSSLANGNWCTGSNLSQTLKDNVREAAIAMGYRLIISGGTATSSVTAGGLLQINMNWKNVGNSPVYEEWDTVFEIQNKTTNAVIWSGISQFNVQYFLPNTNFTGVTDNFTLPVGTPTGTYRLVVKIKDPGNYRNPIALAIQGRRGDGSYTLVDSLVIS
jgi:hypothetical protein